LSELPEISIDLNEVTKKPEDDGGKQFIYAFDKLIEVITKKIIKYIL
jgi:hypothetical protein